MTIWSRFAQQASVFLKPGRRFGKLFGLGVWAKTITVLITFQEVWRFAKILAGTNELPDEIEQRHGLIGS